MPRRTTPSLLCLLFACLLHGQAVPSPAAFDWVATGGGIRSDKVRGLTTGADGSVYIAGESFGDVTFGSQSVKGLGEYDTFLSKISPRGVHQWTRLSGGPKTDRAYGVAVDAKGNVYVTGHFQGETARFEGVEVKGRGDYDAYLASYGPDGALRWVRTAGGKGYDYGHGVAVDAAGDVIVAGALVGQAEIGGQNVDTGKSGGLFCAKYSSDGELKWVRASEGLSGASAHGVAVDAQGRIVIAGLVRGVGEFSGKKISAQPGTFAFVAQLSPAGGINWTAVHPGSPSNLFHEVTCDAQGRVWAVGMYKGRAQVGADVHQSSKPEDSDGIVCHYSA
ncbi:MAG: SBBP repeat-containing protein, partial [Opitutia bacterium]